MGTLDKVLFGILGTIIGVMTIAIIWLIISKDGLKAELAQAQINVTACQLTNSEFAQKAQEQNKAIASLKQEELTRQQQAAKALAEAQKTASQYLKDAKAISMRKQSGDACMAANSLFNTYLEGKP
ncbi:MAG: hypothetical protein KGL39_17940 [Patescibacteria group bacterium]|nr:hypothetical protein [Patescibacteria group bacterium]